MVRGGMTHSTTIGVEEEQNKSKCHPAFEVENLKSVKLYLQWALGVYVREETVIPCMTRFSIPDPFDNELSSWNRLDTGLTAALTTTPHPISPAACLAWLPAASSCCLVLFCRKQPLYLSEQ